MKRSAVVTATAVIVVLSGCSFQQAPDAPPDTASQSTTSAPSTKVLTEDQLRSALLSIDDFAGGSQWSVSKEAEVTSATTAPGGIADDAEPDDASATGDDLFDGTCLAELERDEDNALQSAETAFSDGLFTEVTSSTQTYPSEEVAAEEITAAADRLGGCTSIEKSDEATGISMKVTTESSNDTELTVTLQGRVTDAVQGVSANITGSFAVRRVQNNIALLSFTGISTTIGGEDSTTAPVLTQRAVDKLTAVTTGQPIPPSAAEAELASRTLEFGDTYTGSRSRLTLSPPQPYTPSESAAGADSPRAVQLQVTLENTGSDVINAYDVQISATAYGAEASTIFDEGVDSTPAGDILPGRSGTFTVAFSVPAEPSELTVTASLGLSPDSVYFRGEV